MIRYYSLSFQYINSKLKNIVKFRNKNNRKQVGLQDHGVHITKSNVINFTSEMKENEIVSLSK